MAPELMHSLIMDVHCTSGMVVRSVCWGDGTGREESGRRHEGPFPEITKGRGGFAGAQDVAGGNAPWYWPTEH